MGKRNTKEILLAPALAHLFLFGAGVGIEQGRMPW